MSCFFVLHACQPIVGQSRNQNMNQGSSRIQGCMGEHLCVKRLFFLSTIFLRQPKYPSSPEPNPCRSTMPSHFGWTSTPADSGIMLRLLPRRTCNKDMSNSSSTTRGECGFYLFSQYKASNHYCADYYSSSLCFSLCPPLLWVSRQLNLRRFM